VVVAGGFDGDALGLLRTGHSKEAPETNNKYGDFAK
jgi:hypothetical protein